MAIEAVKIPQNVYVEDRIIGPVTLRHLIILGIGGGISYVVYSAVTKAGFREVPIQVLCWIPLMIAAGFAFLRINDLSLFQIILLFIEDMNKPKLRTWSPRGGLSINMITRETVHELHRAQAKANETIEKLTDMTRQLEKRQEELQRLSHSDQKPENTEPVVTEHQDVIATPENSCLLPERRGRVTASTLEPGRVMDEIVREVPTFAASAIRP